MLHIRTIRTIPTAHLTYSTPTTHRYLHRLREADPRIGVGLLGGDLVASGRARSRATGDVRGQRTEIPVGIHHQPRDKKSGLPEDDEEHVEEPEI